MQKFKSLQLATMLVAIAVTLSACGFHLRGNIPLPEGVKNLFVEAPAGTFSDQLKRILVQAGAEIAPSEGGANAILKIMKAQTKRTVGTLDQRGKADSYNLIFMVRYRVEDLEGNELRKASLQESRRYDFDPELVVESESEEAELLEDMEQDVALRIVRQLSTITDLDE